MGASRVRGSPVLMYYELMDSCGHDMVKWQAWTCVGSRDKIEHVEPLGSLGLNGARDDPAELIWTDGEDL
ncbi:hypothetical protein F511_09412 [Dorcoceras hygrometricum]|uniref:Uncharacterized protein n=1 Tax=Dorcoceras hygrometricum TaxID=472368 RepID=A0A2Z7BGF1_9LAMI|nr:hypothetical protein F511_09412 [Dorcoceras hygrometricum]